MGKRYRSLRKEIRMNLPDGRVIHFYGFRFPQIGLPACEDKTIIEALEAKPGFGKLFWEETDPESILINPQAVPPDCEAAHLQNAARFLAAKGINVNPKFLRGVEAKPDAPQLPAKTTVNTSKKDELQAMIDKHGWEIDKNQKVAELKEAILTKIEELSD
jgi:hypothetical protein